MMCTITDRRCCAIYPVFPTELPEFICFISTNI
jgi:hypothetical protein